jgi:RNA-binding protein 5/10
LFFFITYVFLHTWFDIQKNFKDANLRDIARQKADVARQTDASKTTEVPKYRDRASERRVMHNQPDVPMPAVETNKLGKKSQAEGPPPPPPPPPPPINPGQDQNNMGNKLLKMMGWKEGSGLGSTGEGRVDPMCVCCIIRVSNKANSSVVKQQSTPKGLA